MSDLPDRPDERDRVPAITVESGFLRLPYNEDQFQKFVKGLLGRPQSISRRLSGPFELVLQDIQNLHQLLTQRIAQQNGGVLAQFSAKLVYSDDSTVELASVGELISYNEIRPVVCQALHLRWDYLLLFVDKTTPEKQSILVTYTVGAQETIYDDDSRAFVRVVSDSFHGEIIFRIEHTARSWGADIDALLTNFLKLQIGKESALRRWIRQRSGMISLALGVGFVAVVTFGLFLTTRRFGEAHRLDLANALTQADVYRADAILDFIASFLVSGAWAQYGFAAVVFLVIAVFVGIWLAIWAETAANTYPPSFILLTRESHSQRTVVLKKRQRQWLSFCGSVITTIVLGIASNYLFAFLFGK